MLSLNISINFEIIIVTILVYFSFLVLPFFYNILHRSALAALLLTLIRRSWRELIWMKSIHLLRWERIELKIILFGGWVCSLTLNILLFAALDGLLGILLHWQLLLLLSDSVQHFLRLSSVYLMGNMTDHVHHTFLI